MSNAKNPQNGENIDRFAGLTVHDIDKPRRERIRHRAQAVLAQYSASARPSFIAHSRARARYLEPAAVMALSIMILAWVIERTLFILMP